MKVVKDILYISCTDIDSFGFMEFVLFCRVDAYDEPGKKGSINGR